MNALTPATASGTSAGRTALLERLTAVQRPLRARLRATLPAHAAEELRTAMEQVTVVQAEALMLLKDHPDGLTMHELAAAEGSTPSSATQMVDRLLRLGLVERLHEEEDRRLVRVRITAAASAHIRELLGARMLAMQSFTAPLSDLELETLVGLLEKLAR